MADQNLYTQNLVNPSRVGNELFQLHMARGEQAYANQGNMRTRSASGRGGFGTQGYAGLMGVGEQPDYSAFTYDPAMRAQAQAAGINPVAPEAVQHNAFLPNSGFFGNHPRLSGAIEGALFGAAATRGSDTIGEGISNVASGVLEAHAARQNILNRQFSRPFEANSMLEHLQGIKELREVHEADIQHKRFLDQHETAMDAHLANQDTHLAAQDKYLQSQETNQHIRDTKPEGGMSSYIEPTGDTPGHWTVPEAKPVGGLNGEVLDANIGQPPPAGGPKGKDGLTDRERWGKKALQIQAQQAGIKAGTEASARENAQNKTKVSWGDVTDPVVKADLEAVVKDADAKAAALPTNAAWKKDQRRQLLLQGVPLKDVDGQVDAKIPVEQKRIKDEAAAEADKKYKTWLSSPSASGNVRPGVPESTATPGTAANPIVIK